MTPKEYTSEVSQYPLFKRDSIGEYGIVFPTFLAGLLPTILSPKSHSLTSKSYFSFHKSYTLIENKFVILRRMFGGLRSKW